MDNSCLTFTSLGAAPSIRHQAFAWSTRGGAAVSKKAGRKPLQEKLNPKDGSSNCRSYVNVRICFKCQLF